MDNETKTNLRQSENKLEIVGTLAEMDIHEGKDQNGKPTLEGFIVVKVAELNQVRLNIRVQAEKKDGSSNPAFENISKFRLDAHSIAEVGEENASRVQTNAGQLNPYHSTQSGNDVLGYRTSFVGLYKGSDEEFEPKAEASVELFVQGVVPEMDKQGEETGRALIKGILSTFNGVEPVTIIATEDGGVADAVLGGEIEVGETYEFFADVVNNRVEKTKTIPVKLGKPKIEKTVSYTNELIFTGCSDPYEEGISKAAPFDAGAIKTALQERADRIAADKNKPKGNTGTNQGKPSGASHNRTANW